MLQVLATPGHTADSVSFVLDDAAVLTGDTILGRGTTVVAHPDGALGPYLASLERLRARARSSCCLVMGRSCRRWTRWPAST